MAVIRIAPRFNGPPNSGNGGYSAGLIAGAIGSQVNVRLVQPLPLNRDLTITARAGERWEVRAGDALIATAVPGVVQTDVPAPASYGEALSVAKTYIGFTEHAFPTCFVCGPAREPCDGLRIFPCRIPGTETLAAPWSPDRSLDDGTGKVRPEFIWAALDCPGYFASPSPQHALLGEVAVHIDRAVSINEPCVVMAWKIAVDGRKHRTGTALFNAEGERCALGVATWIELKAAE